jgi:hypothetical protein
MAREAITMSEKKHWPAGCVPTFAQTQELQPDGSMIVRTKLVGDRSDYPADMPDEYFEEQVRVIPAETIAANAAWAKEQATKLPPGTKVANVRLLPSD